MEETKRLAAEYEAMGGGAGTETEALAQAAEPGDPLREQWLAYQLLLESDRRAALLGEMLSARAAAAAETAAIDAAVAAAAAAEAAAASKAAAAVRKAAAEAVAAENKRRALDARAPSKKSGPRETIKAAARGLKHLTWPLARSSSFQDGYATSEFSCPLLANLALKYKFKHSTDAVRLHSGCILRPIGIIKAPAHSFKHLTRPLARPSPFQGGKGTSELPCPSPARRP